VSSHSRPSPLRFEGRVAIVTGAGRGLGRAYALELAARGAAVVVNDLGVDLGGGGLSSEPAEEVVSEIVNAGGRAIASAHDITDVASAEAIVDLAIGGLGQVDVLINNAGFQREGAFEDQDDSAFRSVVDAHLFGTANVTRAAWPHMLDREYGRVVMTTSAIGLWGAPGSTAYGAAKAAVVGLARSLSLEGEGRGITVNCVAPAAETRMSASRFERPGSRRWRPELVVPAVTYLSHESCQVNGSIVSAFAGIFAQVDIVQRDGCMFDVRGDVTAEDYASALAQVTAPNGAAAFVNGHIDALGTPIGRDLTGAAHAATNTSGEGQAW
jgi:NAD(P)-dependent dehydrogenase (short-subunit alcohol dehydrogenase family)